MLLLAYLMQSQYVRRRFRYDNCTDGLGRPNFAFKAQPQKEVKNMPGKDRTGPSGKGPGTGKGRGEFPAKGTGQGQRRKK